MKKTLLMILSFILLSTVTACGARDVVYECNCTYNCEHTPSETVKDDIVESTQSTSNVVPENQIPKTSDLYDEAEKSLYYEAKNLYLTGEWDGTPITMYGQRVSLSESSGAILVNDYIVSNFTHSLDLPDPFTDSVSSNLEYIPGEGMYAIKDKTLVKYIQGECIYLGDSINWIGLDPENPEEIDCKIVNGLLYLPDSKGLDDYTYLYGYEPYLHYVHEADELLFVTGDPISDLSHMYIFTNYNVSETVYLGAISEFHIVSTADRNDIFYYIDLDGNGWEYTKNGPQQLD